MPVPSDVKYALRFLLRTRAFSVPAVASLALGVAVNAIVFSIVSAALLRPLQAPDSHELVRIGRSSGSDMGFRSLSYGELTFLREYATSLASVFGHEMEMMAVDGPGDAQTLPAEIVTGNYFDGLQVAPALGRAFTAREERTSAEAAVAVISDRLWRRQFDAEPGVIGQPIRVNNVALTVVGVAPPGFTGTFPGLDVDLWVPLGAGDLVLHRPDAVRVPTLGLIARLQEGVPIATARAELQVLAQRMADQDPTRPRDRGFSIAQARGIHPAMQRPVGVFLLLLMAAVGLVLCVACANVASLLLARAHARQQEFAVRVALGATRERLVRQLLVESLTLAAAGGSVGVLLAVWPTGLLNRLVGIIDTGAATVSLDVHVDARVLSFTLAVSLATAVIFGLVPALRATSHVFSRLSKHPPSATTQRGRRLRGALIVVQVALSFVLLVSAGLMFRSLHNAAGIDVGFEPDGLVVASFADLQRFGRDRTEVDRFHEDWLARVRAQPNVEHAAFADFVPLSDGSGHPQRLAIPGIASDADAFVPVGRVSEGYFATLGQRLRGRDFTPTDRRGTPAVAIVNEAMARRYWPDVDAVGKRMRIGEDLAELMIVGVVTDGRYTSLADDVPPLVFLPGLPADGTLHVRTRMPPDQALAMARQVAQGIEPRLPPFSGRSMRDAMSASLVPGRIAQFILGIAGLIALLLSAGGLYGLVRYTVEQRLKEMGIRVALGATTFDVFRLMTGGAIRLTMIGLAAGCLLAAGATRLMSALLYGLDAFDPLTFTGISALLLFVASAAGYLAARAGLSKDPVTLLRSE